MTTPKIGDAWAINFAYNNELVEVVAVTDEGGVGVKFSWGPTRFFSAGEFKSRSLGKAGVYKVVSWYGRFPKKKFFPTGDATTVHNPQE